MRKSVFTVGPVVDVMRREEKNDAALPTKPPLSIFLVVVFPDGLSRGGARVCKSNIKDKKEVVFVFSVDNHCLFERQNLSNFCLSKDISRAYI